MHHDGVAPFHIKTDQDSAQMSRCPHQLCTAAYVVCVGGRERGGEGGGGGGGGDLFESLREMINQIVYKLHFGHTAGGKFTLTLDDKHQSLMAFFLNTFLWICCHCAGGLCSELSAPTALFLGGPASG
jgi:hypothetical protein